MTAPTLRAAGTVLSDLAGSMVSVVELVRAALQQDADTQSATLVALDSLACGIGELADRTARAINGGHGVQSPDHWLCSPVVRDALRALERGKVNAPISETAAGAVLRVIDKAATPERTDEAAMLGTLRLLTPVQLDAIERVMDAMAVRDAKQ
jgi:hypothetical protein